jgi:predicted N-formylglutamate amidohydrolase
MPGGARRYRWYPFRVRTGYRAHVLPYIRDPPETTLSAETNSTSRYCQTILPQPSGQAGRDRPQDPAANLPTRREDPSTVPQLLDKDEPPAVAVENADGRSTYFLTCDHAGRRLPRRLGMLGLPHSEIERHIAWDIGAAGTARRMAAALDAILVMQPYSRLVIDCNRAPGVATSIVRLSELTPIPGNENLTEAEAAARVDEIFRPYHDRITAELDQRERNGRPTLLVSVHSFTPVFKGESRRMQVAVLYNRDPRFARLVHGLLLAEGDLVVGENDPYALSDETDYTIPVHGEQRGLPHVELEIRQDLIGDEAGQQAWANRLVRLLRAAHARFPTRDAA